MRYEKKYVSRQGQLNSILLAMRAECSSLVEAHSPRVVNSLYFENQDRLSVVDQVEGNSIRSKFRVRWYGDGGNIENPVLEIKSKVGHVGTKIKSNLAPEYRTVGDLAKTAINDIVDESISLRAHSLMLHPVVRVRYLRRYFLLNGEIRMTVDDQLCFSAASNSNEKPKFYNSWDIIVEFKCDPKHISFLPKLTERTNLRYTKYSKFLSGMEMLSARELARFYG